MNEIKIKKDLNGSTIYFIDLFTLFSKTETDYLFQQLAEKLTDKGFDPNNIEIIFQGEIIE